MKVRIINKSKNPLPGYQTEFSAGADLYADLSEEVRLSPFQRVLVPTGIYIEIPEGYEAQVRPRSGLALKHGITVLNSPGTIDADYRGEISVLLINLGKDDFIIKPGDRIAQMVIGPYMKAEWELCSSLGETVRGNGGYGHTGSK